MNFKCFAENCSNPLKYYCSCQKDYVFSCPEHINQHTDEGDVSLHCIKVMYKCIDSEKKNILINAYQKVSEALLKSQNSIIISINSLVQTLADFKKNTELFFRDQRVGVGKIIDSIKLEDKELIIPELSERKKILHEELQAYYDLLDKKIESFCKSTKQELSLLSELNKDYNEFYDDKIFDFKGNANLDKNLYFFKTGTKLFAEFNVINQYITQFEVNVDEAQGCLGAVCQLPGYKIFHAGGYNPDLASGYIIDLNNHSVEILRGVRGRSFACATYYDNEVYLFAGWHINANLAYCDKFSLATRTWSSLANFPAGAVYSVSALPCREFFILSTLSGNNLYKYDTKKNSYDILTQGVVNHVCNILFRDNDKCFYLANNLCFKSNGENLGIWAKNAKILTEPLGHITSKPVSRNRNVYFVSSQSRIIYKFDLETEDSSKVLTY
ncbi:hypothetical protein SteCoe_36139 [Stentor coeruleus]|uniref:Uncharacterized protein n=1 Tax=Stentor coeruleus TaxID=5963 RepID=A0A1R2AR10_9CILI|nr:hypothetical protein SteCoe_36139 [Stentor coeruleus]